MKSIAKVLVEEIKDSKFWFYSNLIYSDLGNMRQCEDPYASSDPSKNGAYVQITINLTDVPLQIPLSFCLPKECNKKEYFASIMTKVQAMADKLMVVAHEKIDFNAMYSKINGTDHLAHLGRQFSALTSNDTKVSVTLHVPSEQTQQSQTDTEGIMIGVIIGFSCIFVFLFVLPNLYLIMLHSFERRRQKPMSLEQLILKHGSPEQEQAEVKNKTQCQTPKRRLSLFSELSERTVSEARFFHQSILPSDAGSHIDSTRGTSDQGRNQRRADAYKLNATNPSSFTISDTNKQSFKDAVDSSLKPQSSLTIFVNCFNFAEMHQHIWGTKARPWDNRELDFFDGFKLISYVMVSTA